MRQDIVQPDIPEPARKNKSSRLEIQYCPFVLLHKIGGNRLLQSAYITIRRIKAEANFQFLNLDLHQKRRNPSR